MMSDKLSEDQQSRKDDNFHHYDSPASIRSRQHPPPAIPSTSNKPHAWYDEDSYQENIDNQDFDSSLTRDAAPAKTPLGSHHRTSSIVGVNKARRSPIILKPAVRIADPDVKGRFPGRGHARSASHTGFLSNIEARSKQERRGDSALVEGNSEELPSTADSFVKGHQRAFSQGQVQPLKGHRRQGSRAEFVLPEGHDVEKEILNEKKSTGKSFKRSTWKGHSREPSRSDSVYTIRDQKRSLFQRLFFWKKNLSESCTRLVVPNHVVPDNVTPSEHPNAVYPSNEIRTTKYTLLSFFPKNLFEQFHRFANLYFLFIILLNFVPSVNAFAKELSIFPLIFVLGVTAIKDAFEDRRRFKNDMTENHKSCRVYSKSQKRYIKISWADLRVGDIVHLACDEMIPADIVLLNTSDSQGVCYIESSNLDGESHLKQRQSVRLGTGPFDASKFDSILEVGPPTTKIYYFVGSVPISPEERIPLSKDNIILRDCVIKNTDFVDGIVVYSGCETKSLLNNGGPRYKRSKLERQMNREVVWCVVILVLMSLLSAIGSALWLVSFSELISIGPIPFLPSTSFINSFHTVLVDQSAVWIAFTNFWTFVILYQVLIPISLYVSIEVIKVMQVYHIHQDPDFHDSENAQGGISCRALNIGEELGQIEHVFSDKTGTLTENNMVFQRCSINGVDYNHTPLSVVDKCDDTNDTFLLNSDLKDELKNLELQFIYTQGSAPGHQNRSASMLTKNAQRILDFFFILSACNTVVVAKRPHRDQMNDNGLIVHPSEEDHRFGFHTPLHIRATTSSLFRSLFPSRPLSPINPSPQSTPPETPKIQLPLENSGMSHSKNSPRLDSTLSNSKIDSSFGNPILESSLNNSKIPECPEESFDSDSSISYVRPLTLPLSPAVEPILPQPHVGVTLSVHGFQTPSPDFDAESPSNPIYEAESPDEVTLVNAAARYGVTLLRRNLNSVVVAIPGLGVRDYEVLNVLPFDSNRKRMSIIVKNPENGQKVLYTKGADSAILENLSRKSDEIGQLHLWQMQQQLKLYSKIGLRVLCMAKRLLTDQEYQDWLSAHQQAENALAHREKKLIDSFCKIEREFQLIGATGIEDRLQDGVPETLKSLKAAGIKIWILTGDKQETAVNIAFSCSLFTPSMEILMLNAGTRDQTERIISSLMRKILDEEELRFTSQAAEQRKPSSVGSRYGGTRKPNAAATTVKSRGLVVDGRTLVFILDRRANLKDVFLKLACNCDAILCCRANPLQKALIVKTAKEKLGVLTLAVGDGANDVSMIQTADVGVGISGVEGCQAVMSSDYAIHRFRFLEKLLLVHGHWSYDRLAKIILFFFYKNSYFVFLLLWFQLFCGFSTSVMIDDMYLVVFNLLFTSIPPLTVGIYDQIASADLLLSKPNLYSRSQRGSVYTARSFWVNILDAFYQSSVVFFFAVEAYYGSDVGFFEFGMSITHACLLTQLLHISIETKSWTIIHFLGIVLSYFFYILFGLLYTVAGNGVLGLPSQYGEFAHMMTSSLHWLYLLVTIVAALLPRFVARVMQTILTPCEVTRVAKEIKAQNSGWFLNKISRASSAASVGRRLLGKQPFVDDSESEALGSLVTMTTGDSNKRKKFDL